MKATAISLFSIAWLSTALALPSQDLTKRSSVKGFDISHYQPNVDFTSAYTAGLRFVMIKATESADYISPSFSDQYTGATNAGFIRGGYHFARPGSSSGSAQADYFLKNGGGWSNDSITLPGMLDLEVSDCDGLSTSDMVAWIRSFVDTYHSATERYPILYFSPSWWTQCTGDSEVFSEECPLDVASWGSEVGSIPGGWSTQTIWQYADSNPYGGDSDEFNGDEASLKKLASG
ncbi:MAG: hypothetical protein Q9157_001884 [Trypethelium eluteriae]